jgi:hypothetical protein
MARSRGGITAREPRSPDAPVSIQLKRCHRGAEQVPQQMLGVAERVEDR